MSVHTGEAVLPVLQRLQKLQVSKQILMATGAGKHVRSLGKSSIAKVAQTAKLVVEAWKTCVLNS